MRGQTAQDRLEARILGVTRLGEEPVKVQASAGLDGHCRDKRKGVETLAGVRLPSGLVVQVHPESRGNAFGNGGLAPLNLSAGFTHGAEIGVLLLLFMLGLEYTGREQVANLRCLSCRHRGLRSQLTPGVIAGLLLKWNLSLLSS
jgi:hypothetical protein